MRSVDTATSDAVALTKTKALVLVELGFDPVVRLCTRSTTIWGGNAWLYADLTVSDSEPPNLSIFNNAFGIGAIALTQGTAGRTVKVWQAYGTEDVVSGAPAGFGTPVMTFYGEMGRAVMRGSMLI